MRYCPTRPRRELAPGEDPTTRRGTAAADLIPVLTMPKPTGAFSQGRHPAEDRHACSDPRTTEWR